ncbi:hypothetical protein BDV95DRAFT_671771 [Massariosphaeria phaeospora]|uniref:Uncharacterized protein n=1 Tax=Massariosphaeria phaeospora TaxID=100035 RepID=A0A7C8M8E6_9PLEO|nr:hypothetical protein BDV95DRAFT_671771 [Massariosphaeria phaeospora]
MSTVHVAVLQLKEGGFLAFTNLGLISSLSHTVPVPESESETPYLRSPTTSQVLCIIGDPPFHPQRSVVLLLRVRRHQPSTESTRIRQIPHRQDGMRSADRATNVEECGGMWSMELVQCDVGSGSGAGIRSTHR